MKTKPTSLHTLRLVLLVCGAALVSPNTARAQTKAWVGGTSTDWNTGGNWSLTGVPGSGTSVIISTNSGNQPVLSSGANAALGSGTVTVGTTAATSGTNTLLTIQSGMTLSNAGVVLGNTSGATGHVLVKTSGGWTSSSGTFTVGNGGTGTLDVQSGGTVSSITSILGATSTGTGTANVDGTNSHWTTGALRIGSIGTGTLGVTNGGVVTTNASGEIGTGAATTGNGSATISGTNSTWVVAGNLTVGLSGTGSLTINSGGLVTAGGLSMGLKNGSSGTLSVSGGTFTSGTDITVGQNLDTGTTTATLNISGGGTVNATSTSGLNVARDAGTIGTLNIGAYAGGTTAGALNSSKVVFGSGTGTVNFNQTDSTTFSAQISGGGSVNQRGSGTTTLSGYNGYTGATTVSSGKLMVDNYNGLSSGVSVSAGATLGGHGYVSKISGDGLVSPGNSPGILTATQVDPSSGLDFTFQFGQPGAPTYSNAAASGNDVLHISSGTPFTSALNSTNKLTLDFTGQTLHVGDIYYGGFFTDTAIADSLVNGATFDYLGLNGASIQFDGMTAVGSADFASGTVLNGEIMKFEVISGVPEPATGLAGIAVGAIAFFARQRRRCTA